MCDDHECLGGLWWSGRRVGVSDGKEIFGVGDEGRVEVTVIGHRGGDHPGDDLRNGSCDRESGAHVRVHFGPAR